MSAKLIQALASGKVTIKKLISGEVMLKFANPQLGAFTISDNKPVEVTKLKGVTVSELKRSNLKDLITAKMIDILE